MESCEGQVAVVAGATRGAGVASRERWARQARSCTARAERARPAVTLCRPGDIDESAGPDHGRGRHGHRGARGPHDRKGGRGTVRARGRERGRLDVLVNSIAGEDPMMSERGSFWEADLGTGEAILRQATGVARNNRQIRGAA